MIAADELECMKTLALALSADEKCYSGSYAEIDELATRTRNNLKSIFYSNLPSESVNRFLEYQFEELVAIARIMQQQSTVDNAGKFHNLANQVNGLLDFVLRLYPACGSNTLVPANYLDYKMTQLKASSKKVGEIITCNETQPYTCPILNYVKKLETGKHITFYALGYYAKVLDSLSATVFSGADLTSHIHSLVLELNFNDLGYLCYYQDHLILASTDLSLKQKEIFFDRQAQLHFPYKSLTHSGCYPQLPHLGSLIYQWLQEYRALLPLQVPTVPASNHNKLLMNIPVAHIAMMIKLLYEQEVFGKASLSEIFNFTCNHLSSKRQEKISKGSLSKEYYSINQVTAGRVMAMLQQMTQKIRRDFFPG